jgi:pimeloyl-ACP methyl ester carboxylesterase
MDCHWLAIAGRLRYAAIFKRAVSSMQEFSVVHEGVALRGDRFAGANANNALYLHGAGASTRHGHSLLRGALRQRGIGTTCFDCIGHGETGGSLAQSSVASRTRQARAVVEARGLPQPLAVFGVSMGAYNAIKLTEHYQVEALVLMVPGVYTPEAYEVPFGPEFSAIIRRERSWADTDAWDILARFEGDLLVLAAEHDAVIPLEIPLRLVASAVKARSSKLHVVPGAEHNRLWSLLAEQPDHFSQTMDLVTACLRREPQVQSQDYLPT